MAKRSKAYISHIFQPIRRIRADDTSVFYGEISAKNVSLSAYNTHIQFNAEISSNESMSYSSDTTVLDISY